MVHLVGGRKAEAMLILLRARLFNEKIRQVTRSLKSSEELSADLLTKPAVVPAFIPFGLEFREH